MSQEISPESPISLEKNDQKEDSITERPESLLKSESKHVEKSMTVGTTDDLESERSSQHVVYKLYKRRWLGIVTLMLYNIVSGMNGQFFGPITTSVNEEWGIPLTRINWTSNLVNLVYLPATFITIRIFEKVGIKKTVILGGIYLVLANWIRMSATASSVDANGKFAIAMVSQMFIGLAQACCQIMTVRYSELWFDVRGRVVATMLTNISNPLGGAIGSLVLPRVGSTNRAILTGAIIATVVFPFGFLISERPPSPPTYAGTTKSQTMRDMLKAMIGRVPKDHPSYMDFRDRLDFGLLFITFGVFCSATTSWSNFGNQTYGPHGYSQSQVGLFDATILLAGIVAAVGGAPILGRLLGKKLPFVVRIILPILSICWVAQIWNVRPNNSPAIYAVMAVIGIGSFILLPLGLELGAEATRNAEASCGLLWFNVNLVSFAWILIEDALRAGPDGRPPNNMTQALIFNGSTVAAAAALFVVGFRGDQKRREKDIVKLHEAMEKDEARGRHDVQVFVPNN